MIRGHDALKKKNGSRRSNTLKNINLYNCSTVQRIGNGISVIINSFLLASTYGRPTHIVIFSIFILYFDCRQTILLIHNHPKFTQTLQTYGGMCYLRIKKVAFIAIWGQIGSIRKATILRSYCKPAGRKFIVRISVYRFGFAADKKNWRQHYDRRLTL